jgi:hypothetical protein
MEWTNVQPAACGVADQPAFLQRLRGSICDAASGGLSQGERKLEIGPLPHFALHYQITAVLVRDSLGHR